MNAMERLNQKIKEKNSRIVAGVDPTLDILPPELKPHSKDAASEAKAIKTFCYQYVKAVADYVPAIKINGHFFEKEKLQPIYREIARFAQNLDLFVIADLKRADIGSTSKASAEAWLEDGQPFDAMTVNPYLGTDGVKPFIEIAAENGKGVFILDKTSNKSSKEIQDKTLFETRDYLYEHVADLIESWGKICPTDGRYSMVGAVVGATHPKEAALLRTRMKNTMFLVPGYGAQGATAEDVAVNFDEDGLGAIVNSSRGLMAAYKKEAYADLALKDGWIAATMQATKDAVKDINDVIKK